MELNSSGRIFTHDKVTLFWSFICVIGFLRRKTGTEWHLPRGLKSGGGVTKTSMSKFETVVTCVVCFLTGKFKVEALGLIGLRSGSRVGLSFGNRNDCRGNSSESRRWSDRTVSVEEHRERFVSARIFIGGGLQNSNSLVTLRKHPIQMFRQSLFIRRRKKNTRQTIPGATMFINERTVLYEGDLQSVEV